MSNPKEKYFIVDFSEGVVFERNTLPEALRLITTWLENDEETEEQIDDGTTILIKGTRVEIKVETTKTAIQK